MGVSGARRYAYAKRMGLELAAFFVENFFAGGSETGAAGEERGP